MTYDNVMSEFCQNYLSLILSQKYIDCKIDPKGAAVLVGVAMITCELIDQFTLSVCPCCLLCQFQPYKQDTDKRFINLIYY